MTRQLGDYKEDETLYFLWSTNNGDGASITRATNGTISVYKDNNVAQSTAGITDTEDFDSLTGIHACTIDLSADAFYAVGSDYAVVLSAATIDGQVVNAVLAHFSIENRFQEVDVVKWLGQACAAVSQNGVPEVDLTYIAGVLVAAASAQLGVNVVQIEGADPTNTIRDSVVDDATRIDASALNTLSSHAPDSTIADVNDIPSAADVADQVWDEARAGHTGAGTYGETLATVEANIDNLDRAISTAESNIRGADSDDLKDISDQIDAMPTATENAGALLDRDLSAVGLTDGRRSLGQAIRRLVNKVTVSVLGVMTVYKEDDVTAAWTANVTTNPSANNITEIDPT